jgi:hypothetical protein
MRLRCQTARPLGKFMLTSARLVFRCVADLEYDPNSKTPCGLWMINQADERALDWYEGVDSGLYFKSEEIVLKYQDRPRNALIYLMRSDAIYPPSQSYADTIRQGYKDFGLNEKYLDEAIARSFDDKAPDNQTTARRARQRDRHQQLVEMPVSVAMKRLDMRG